MKSGYLEPWPLDKPHLLSISADALKTQQFG
ncbi:uncharacterized protein G2W53_043928 [Senna tora]|uniref:Uncharacterized protein n=1 Tax=Senna tora TaxID=362788 RepID=A0A834W0M1_9FABA|nr:uncharacterized protein G2W53_043928 [Senna tora]